MRRVGQVVRATGGLAVVRSPDGTRPEFGTDVVDESLTAVGRVVDVFGPVERPYLAVTPADRRPAALLGEVLYARDSR